MDHGVEVVLEIVVVAVSLGILAQVLAHRWKLPAILPLLISGMVVGPHGLGFLQPEALGHGLEVIIHLGVAIILFEGGLSLDLRQLRQVGGAIRNLLVVGCLATGAGAAWLMHALTAVSWPTAALFGAIVTVTGPTVIAPLLRHMIAPRKVRTILLSEGLMIDPVGAVLAYLVLQWIDRSGAGVGLQPLAFDLLRLCLIGSVLGFAAGAAAVYVIKSRHMNDEMRNLVILALLLASFFLAEQEAPQSGILASVVMGLTVTGWRLPDLNPLKAFKGQLTVLVISVLFVLLSAQLDLAAVRRLGVDGLLVVAGLILLVRPVSVLLSVPPKQLDWRQKVILAFNAPRGIVAAAVASLAAIALAETPLADEASTLEGLVYLTILVTCTWSTLMAKLLPRLLGYVGDPSRRRVVLVGANPVAAALARVFHEQGWTAVVVDGVKSKLAAFQQEGFRTVPGDARDAATYEEAGVERDSEVISLTTNDELNLLVAELVREEFGVEHPVVALQQPSNEFGERRRAWIDLLGGREAELPRWMRELEDGTARMLTLEMTAERGEGEERLATLRTLLREERDEISLLCGWAAGKPEFRYSLGELQRFNRLTLLIRTPQAHQRLKDALRHPESPPAAASGPVVQPA